MPPGSPETVDPDTEIASNFTVGRYWELRPLLDPIGADGAEWAEVLAAFRRRIRERFLKPIGELARHDTLDDPPTRPGFAILALDCLLIDAIQAFREGRARTNDVSPARSFKDFLRAPRFVSFNSRDRDEFFHYVRNGLLPMVKRGATGRSGSILPGSCIRTHGRARARLTGESFMQLLCASSAHTVRR